MNAVKQAPRGMRARANWGWGGLAYFNGALVIASWPTESVRSLLPPPLTTRPAHGAAEHPLVFIFGELERGGAHVAGVDWPIGTRYREMGVMIPFIRSLDGEIDGIFPLEMFADDPRPVVLGNAVYGLRKQQARIHWSGPAYEVVVDGQRRFGCTGALLGNWSKSIERDHPVLLSLQQIFSASIVGSRSDGSFVRSRFDWELAGTEARHLAGQVDWCAPGTRDPIRFAFDRDQAVLVRGMRWRTSSPERLSWTGHQ